MASSPKHVDVEDDVSEAHQGHTNGKEASPDHNKDAVPSTPAERPPLLKRIWKKLGINGIVVMIMVKPAVAATISMAIFQSQKVAVHYQNLGYLIIIVSVTTVPILPRGKFLLNLFLSLLLTCFAAGMVCLGQWAGVKAREHTTPPGASPAVANGYNSSASAVNAIFLMFNIFLISVLRALRPVFAIPGIQYTVFVMVGFIYGPQEPTVHRSQLFLKELLYSFLTGQAISTGVSLLIIPVSSRKVFFGETTGFLQSCRGLLKAQMGFIQVMSRSAVSSATGPKGEAEYNQKVAILKSSSSGLLSLGAKLREDVMFAKREIAFGHLLETDIHAIHGLLRDIMIPITGLSTIADIAERSHCHSGGVDASQTPGTSSDLDQNGWKELFEGLSTAFETVVQILDDGILHTLILLGLAPSPKKKAPGDVEVGTDIPKPGDPKFGDYLEQKVREFRKERSSELQRWTQEQGLNSVFKNTVKHKMPPTNQNEIIFENEDREVVASKRLHVILYMEYLLYSTAMAILGIVRFAESKIADGTMAKKRFIWPAYKTLVRIIQGLINGDEPGPDTEEMEGFGETVALGDSLQAPKDPEHLPPKNARQALGDHLRSIPKFLGSDAVRFGVRVTIAVMSIGIMAYLKNTHAFFVKQRVVWALVMIAIGMSPTAGSAVFNMLGNTTCTTFGMIGSYINWYMVDGKTAGVIVFFFFFLLFYFYFAAKFPRFLVAIVAGALTHVLVIGYELQVRVIGIVVATATGQEFYPIYELAPFRLLTVAGGCFVAYIWTIFPVPITEGSVLRRDLGISLYLLANYLSAVTATVDERLTKPEGDLSRRLSKLRHKILAKQVMLINSMRQNLSFLAWEPRLGGEFPKDVYKSIIDELQDEVNYLTIISYASESFRTARENPQTSKWLSEFARSRPDSDEASHKITSLLALLSASVLNGHALPPYLKAPTDTRFSSDALVNEQAHTLDLQNLNEPGFRAIAVIEVAQRCMADSINRIVAHVKELVGEVDFSYRIKDVSEASSVLGGNGEPKEKVY
ncbi:hypothetical protein N431DRAFT_458077 [Stipitochalara longipes BDJ]|nr:hypothetical protein N431DRAFT_458077 [Stipitochalara longipes BDJ]